MMISKSVTKRIIAVCVLLITFILLLYHVYYADAEAIKNIQIEVLDLNITNPKITHCTITFLVNITNPSSRTVSDLSSTFKIYIENNYIGKGNFSHVHLPSSATLKKEIPVKVYYGGLADAVVDLVKNLVQGYQTTVTIKGNISGAALFGFTQVSHQFTVVYS